LHCLLCIFYRGDDKVDDKEETILLFVLLIYLLWRSRKNKVHKKDVAFLNIAEDGWLHVEAGPVNSPTTQQQPGTLHTSR
jgi:hypothetical protein